MRSDSVRLVGPKSHGRTGGKVGIVLLAGVLLAIGCGSGAASGRTDASMDAGSAPLDLPAGQWSYVDFPNATCGDGSSMGLLVSPGSDGLLFFMEGGAECLDYADCTSGLYPIGQPENRDLFGPVPASEQAAFLGYLNDPSSWDPNSIFSRSDPDNVFRNFTYVYVIACTGDLYAGDNVVTSSNDSALMFDHAGRPNTVAFLDRLVATWPDPPRVVVAGSSLGGLGALFNYDTIRQFWPSTKMYLVDDSGTLLLGHPLPGIGMGWSDWNFQSTVGEFCSACRNDASTIYAALSAKYPDDRKSLLSHLDDPVYEYADGLGTAAFSEALRATAAGELEPNDWSWFFDDESGHTFINTVLPGSFASSQTAAVVSNGVSVKAFLKAQIDDDPTWSSVPSSADGGVSPGSDGGTTSRDGGGD